MISKLIYTLGSKIRNPSLFSSYKFLKKAESLTLEELRSHQLKEVKRFLIFVNKYSDYYRRKFKENLFDPNNISSLDDLKNIPTISKEELIEHNDEIHSKYQFNKLFFCETSGSSGQVLTFRRNEHWDSMNRAAIWRGYSWYGVNPWDKNLYFWGYDLNSNKRIKTAIQDFLQNRFRLFDYSSKSLASISSKVKKLTYVHGYSSMIYETAKTINEQELSLDTGNIKMIKGTSEKIYPHYHSEVERAFDKKIISEYGAAETGIIAFECPKGNMHLNMEGCYVEEENGEIVVTNYLSYSFPIIRYKLGDYIKLSSITNCECGMHHPILEEVKGRVGKNIYGKEKKYPSLTLYYIFKNLFFTHGISLNYRCFQFEKGVILVKISNAIEQKTNTLILDEFQKYFSNDLKVDINDNEVIHTHEGKLTDFISELE